MKTSFLLINYDPRTPEAARVATKLRKFSLRTKYFSQFLVLGFCTLGTWALYCEYIVLVLSVHGFCTGAGGDKKSPTLSPQGEKVGLCYRQRFRYRYRFFYFSVTSTMVSTPDGATGNVSMTLSFVRVTVTGALPSNITALLTFLPSIGRARALSLPLRMCM